MLELIRTSASPEPLTTSFDTHTVMLENVATSFADEAATTDISLQLETAGQWWRLTHFFSNRQASDTTGPILGEIDSAYLRGTAIWVCVKAQQYRSVLPTPTDNIQPRTRLRKILVAAWRSKRSSKFGSSHRLAVSKVQATILPPREPAKEATDELNGSTRQCKELKPQSFATSNACTAPRSRFQVQQFLGKFVMTAGCPTDAKWTALIVKHRTSGRMDECTHDDWYRSERPCCGRSQDHSDASEKGSCVYGNRLQE